MRNLLQQSNRALLHELDNLHRLILGTGGSIAPELKEYLDWALQYCEALREGATQISSYLNLNEDSILDDLLSQTQAVTREFQLFNRQWVGPLLRARKSDRLCLRFLRWLHSTHPGTARTPVALRDDEFSLLPLPDLPAIYGLPCSAQYGLLFLPLFFHEFGHLL